MRSVWFGLVIMALGSLNLSGRSAMAATTLPDGTEVPDVEVSQLLPESAIRVLTRTMAILTAHRPYQGATPLGPGGIAFGVEASLVHLPNGFQSELSGAGVGGATGTGGLGALPIAKLHLHRGLSPRSDIGFSGLYWKGSYILGGDLKFLVFEPEEGFLWSVRLGYSETQFDLSSLGLKGVPIKVQGVEAGRAGLKLRSRAITPAIVGSKRIDVAEPYVGSGLEYVTGHIEFPVKLNVLSETQTLTTGSYSAAGLTLFTGVNFRMPILGLTLGLEGGYATLGTHYFGLMAGLSF